MPGWGVSWIVPGHSCFWDSRVPRLVAESSCLCAMSWASTSLFWGYQAWPQSPPPPTPRPYSVHLGGPGFQGRLCLRWHVGVNLGDHPPAPKCWYGAGCRGSSRPRVLLVVGSPLNKSGLKPPTWEAHGCVLVVVGGLKADQLHL